MIVTKKTFCTALLVLAGCFINNKLAAQQPELLKPGMWRGVLKLNDTTDLPFSFSVVPGAKQQLIITNGEERIFAEQLSITADSVNWRMPVFDSGFRCRRDSATAFHGIWVNRNGKNPVNVPFKAVHGQVRFPAEKPGFRGVDVDGRWACSFSPGKADSSAAVGIFTSTPRGIIGTFLTETGDYRYLQGDFVKADVFKLSCFDGAHAFLFRAQILPDGTISGRFWSGTSWTEPWTAYRNESYQLRNPEQLTWVTDSSKIGFTFRDLNGNPVSLSDPRFEGKVVVVQLMGSWCPNCMDETRWLAGLHKKYANSGFEVVALCYERSTDTARANANIRRMKTNLNANYLFLNTGLSGKDQASASLPFLNGVMAFPTTLYIDRTGKVRKIHTGFSGPGTGAEYERFTSEMNVFIQQLLAEGQTPKE
ncbi:MAG: TlpA family protein disulfide reductase [Bacteroidia bacterium]|jgi:thiol-disulfide isomerase/thioredoxin|nr:TlpA family protein disulfide reductase [Bacteroidia bacterium]